MTEETQTAPNALEEALTPPSETPAEETTPTSQTPETSTTETPAVHADSKAEGESEGEKPPEGDTPSEGDDAPSPLTFDDLKAVELPEGYELRADDPLTGEFLEILNDTEAKDIPARLVQLHAKIEEANIKQWLDTQETWQTELKNDPNIGGDNLEPSLNKIGSLMHEFASTHGDEAAEIEKTLRAQFDTTGAGNNPPIVRFLVWTASQLSEGVPLGGGSGGEEKSRAERMFGT